MEGLLVMFQTSFHTDQREAVFKALGVQHDRRMLVHS